MIMRGPWINFAFFLVTTTCQPKETANLKSACLSLIANSCLMSAITSSFPTAQNILCTWHIEKNVLGNLRKNFETEELWEKFMTTWKGLLICQDASQVQKQWDEIASSYAGVVADYLKKTWMPYKELFISAWTDKVQHLGHRVTSVPKVSILLLRNGWRLQLVTSRVPLTTFA